MEGLCFYTNDIHILLTVETVEASVVHIIFSICYYRKYTVRLSDCVCMRVQVSLRSISDARD